MMSYAKRAFSLLLLLVLAATLPAQQSGQGGPKIGAARSADSSAARKETALRWTRYCLELGGFCFDHPAGWSNLGAVYNGAGVVFAEPNKARAQTEWNHITAAALDLPQSPQQSKNGEPAAGNERLSLNELINLVMKPAEGAAIHTLERRETMVGGYPAQVVTAEVQERGQPVAIEQAAFIDADDVIYSLALRCAPADYKRLKPVFSQALKSWSEIPESSPGQSGAPEPGAGEAKPGNEQTK